MWFVPPCEFSTGVIEMNSLQAKTTDKTVTATAGPDYSKQLTAIAAEKAAHASRVAAAKRESRRAARARK
jgi:hypothetical protein